MQQVCKLSLGLVEFVSLDPKVSRFRKAATIQGLGEIILYLASAGPIDIVHSHPFFGIPDCREEGARFGG